MGRACSMHGRSGMNIGFRWESQKERNHYEDIGGSIILKQF
jgi:hypothetical protein